MGDGPLLSVVIVTWNSAPVVGGCLDALAANPPSGPWEAIVVDNGSSDATAEVVKRHPLGARLIANRENRGLAAANNQGITAAAGAFVLLANPDTEVTPGAVDAMRGLLERRPRAAFVIPRLRYPDGRPQVSAGDLPTLSEALLGRQAQGRRAGEARGFWWEGWPHDEERRIGRGHEACYLARRSAIDEIGPQDEGFVLDWEGIDWAARAQAAGWEVWFTPSAEVVHLGGASIRQAPVRWIAGSHRGMYRYFAKRGGRARRPLLAVVIALRALVKVAGVLVGPATYDRSHRT
jgi:N-acetylglucosaminyl-diphospho-decaprenol L-rhamnosyltransferase